MKGGALVMGLVPLIEEEKPELSSLSAMGGHRKERGISAGTGFAGTVILDFPASRL